MVCGYWPVRDVYLLACDIDNRSVRPLELWITQKAKTEDAEVTKKTRIYKGAERTIHGQWKVSSVAEKEEVIIRLTGDHGTIIRRKLK
jgi:hypothetical protein